MEQSNSVEQKAKTNLRLARGLGIASLVISILSLIFFRYIFISITLAIAASIMGAVGLKKGDNMFALAGLTIGIVSLLITFFLYVILNLLDTALFYVPEWYK